MTRRWILTLLFTTAFSQAFADIFFPEFNPDACQMADGSEGTCTPFLSCPSAYAAFPAVSPVPCGFQGNSPLVCCQTTRVVTEDPRATLQDISPPVINFACGDSTPLELFPFDFGPPDYEPEPPVDTSLNLLLEDFRRQGFIISDVERIDDRVTGFTWSNGTHDGYEFERMVFAAVGGRSARPVLTKYMALLGDRDNSGLINWFCDGVLINEMWVLTAAHCIVQSTVSVVRLGEHDYNDEDEGAIYEDFGVAEILRYPDYRFPVAYHDLALLKLDRQVRFTPHINPVCLPWGREAERNIVNQKITLTGWGATEFGGTASSILQEVNVTVFHHSRCDQSYSTVPQYSRDWPNGIGKESLCAGDPEGGKDACQGDSGGPVVYLNERNQFVLAGIVSRGLGCGHADFPGLYVNMREGSYLSWVKREAF